jgi:FkbM family methyltransferase
MDYYLNPNGQVPLTHANINLYARNIAFNLYCHPDFVSDVLTRMWFARSGMYEPDITRLMFRVLREGDFAIDCGANVGALTLTMSRLVGDSGRVLAVEAAPRACGKLRANLELNRIRNVTVINKAVWEDDGDVVLHQSVDAGLSSLRPIDGEISAITCPSVTLAQLCGDDVPRFIKMDMEGAEGRALMASGPLLDRGVDFICCEINRLLIYNFDITEVGLRDYMAAHGYAMFILHEDDRMPTEVKRGHLITSKRNSINVLFSTVDKVCAAWGE